MVKRGTRDRNVEPVHTCKCNIMNLHPATVAPNYNVSRADTLVPSQDIRDTHDEGEAEGEILKEHVKHCVAARVNDIQLIRIIAGSGPFLRAVAFCTPRKGDEETCEAPRLKHRLAIHVRRPIYTNNNRGAGTPHKGT